MQESGDILSDETYEAVFGQRDKHDFDTPLLSIYEGDLDPHHRLDAMELNSKNGFKNYDYVPLSKETVEWLKENYLMPGYFRNGKITSFFPLN